MSIDSRLHYYIQEQIPKEIKEDIIRTINGEFFEGKGSAAKNAKVIYNWLKKHNNIPPVKLEEYSVDHSKEFISKTLYGEYYPERIPEYDNKEELKQLELMREAIDERIKELQKEQISEEIYQYQQQEQHRLNDNYEELYMNNLDTWNMRYVQEVVRHLC